MSVITPEEVWTELGRNVDELSEPQRLKLANRIDDIQSELEDHLNRVVERRTIAGTYEVSASGYLYLPGPIIRIDSVMLDTETPGDECSWTLPYRRYVTDAIVVPGSEPGMIYRVIYVAGDDPISTNVRNLVKNVVVRGNIVGISVTSGAVSRLAVEGTSASFGQAFNDPQAVGSFSVTELKTVKKLKRIVTR
jgi:hypothetical protein